MDVELWKLFITLGVPGLALGVLYMLFKRFDWRLPIVPKSWVGPIAVLFIITIATIVLYTLKLWAPHDRNASRINEITPSNYPQSIQQEYKPHFSVNGAGFRELPYISALSGGSIEDRYYVLRQTDWEKNVNKEPGNDEYTISEKSINENYYIPLPGLLVFCIQNMSGEKAPKITIRSLALQTRIGSFKKVPDSELFRLIYYHVPFANTIGIPSTRGKVTITQDTDLRTIAIPNKPEYMLDHVYRSLLSSGEESCYVIDLDANFYGIFSLNADLIISWHYVSESRTIVGESIIEDFINIRLVRLPNEKQVEFLSYFGGMDQQTFEKQGIVRVDKIISFEGSDFNWRKYYE